MSPLPIIIFTTLLADPSGPAAEDPVRLEIRVTETAGGDPLPCRIHLVGPDREPVHAPDLPFWNDHFVCRGEVALELAPGPYELTVERGPEYRRATSRLRLEAGGSQRKDVLLTRIDDLAARGWWSGETHIHRDPAEMALHLAAEDLHVAPVLTIWNQRSTWTGQEPPAAGSLLVRTGPNRVVHRLSLEDERQGGALLYHRLDRPVELGAQGREQPSPVENLRRIVEQPDVVVEIEKPFWWDTPAWLATGEVDLIGLANNHMCRSTMLANEAWGRARDVSRLPPPRGNGFYTQELYYRILNCGFRIPPTAGSASGVLANPVGYNRVYVHLEGDFSWDAWWEGLLAGRSFVTNGPLLLARANGRLPGETFRLDDDTALSLEISVRITSNDPLERIDLVRDGEIIETLRPGPGTRSLEQTFELAFERGGWCLVRAVAAVPETFRFASTSPFWVEAANRPMTPHARDVQHFIDWVDDRIEQIRAGVAQVLDGEALAAVLAPHRRARKLFRGLLEGAR